MSAQALLIITTTFFSVFVVCYYRMVWRNKKESERFDRYSEAILMAVKKNFAELKDKEMLLVVDKGYGVFDSSRWEDEIDSFTCLVIVPLLQMYKIERFESTEQKRKFMLFSKSMIKDLLCHDVLPVMLTAKECVEGRRSA